MTNSTSLRSWEKVTAREFMAKCIYAWNAYRDGKKSLNTLRYYPNAPDPEAK